MAEARPTFDDGAAYDEFMGRWSRAVGAVFLDWLAAPRKAAWLDVGCGTGLHFRAVQDRGYTVIGADVSADQLRELDELFPPGAAAGERYAPAGMDGVEL